MISKFLDDNETKPSHTGAQVLIFPARTSELEGLRVFYLFSVRQVAEVLRHADVQSVPFGPEHAEGVTEWRGRVLPVLSLEHYLGIKISNKQMPLRTIVVRSVTRGNGDDLHENHAVCKVGAAVRQLELPLACEPTDVPDWVTNASCLNGVYKMQESLFLVINIEKIINPEISENRHVQ